FSLDWSSDVCSSNLISKGKKGKKHSEKSKEAFRQAQLKRYRNPKEVERAKEFLSRGREKTREKSLARSQEILDNAERNEEYLHKIGRASCRERMSV